MKSGLRTSFVRNYTLFAGCMVIASFLTVLLIQVYATFAGLSGGGYGVVISTDSAGENYLELVVELLTIPGAVLLFKRLLESDENGPRGSSLRTRRGKSPQSP